MRHVIKRRNFWIVFVADISLLTLAYFLSYLIRFEGKVPSSEILNFANTVWFIVPVKFLALVLFQLYKGMWRYTSIKDLVNLIWATFAGSCAAVVIILYISRFEGYSRSVFVIDAGLTLIFVGGVRLAIRVALLFNPLNIGQGNGFRFLGNHQEKSKKLLIIGAGDAGERILRELQRGSQNEYTVVGFVDDDRKKLSMQIHGIPVLGCIDQLSAIAPAYGIDEILIAVASAQRGQIRRIVSVCRETGLAFRIIPAISELLDGKLSVQSIREVAYEDLLGRLPVRINQAGIGEYLSGKSVLVTGAGGSIGSELCRMVARFFPRNLILFDRTENNLFQIEMEMQREFPNLKCESVLGSIVTRSVLERTFMRFRPQVVFHAAAYKHVPMMELNPWEAIFTNVKGTKNVFEVSRAYEVERFVFVSTDKAVRPSNVMGATKRVAELLMQSYNGSCHPTRFMAVRFGNVIGSSGSVIPVFKKQIEEGGPVTVTHPEVTRYFMTIPEAAQLILQAGAMGEGGETFVLDMGQPVNILDLAHDLIRLSGFEPNKDIEVKFIGLRPGEKLYEELITEGEGINPTSHERIFVLRKEPCNLRTLNERINELLALANEQDALGIKNKLKEILPEYTPYQQVGATEKIRPIMILKGKRLVSS